MQFCINAESTYYACRRFIVNTETVELYFSKNFNFMPSLIFVTYDATGKMH